MFVTEKDEDAWKTSTHQNNLFFRSLKQKLKQKTIKKSIFILTVLNLVAGILITGCKSDTGTESNTDDVELSPEATEQLKEDYMLEDIQAKKIAYEDSVEWEAYKKETEVKIKANEKRINPKSCGEISKRRYLYL